MRKDGDVPGKTSILHRCHLSVSALRSAYMYVRTAALVTVMGVLTVVSAQTAKQHWLPTVEDRVAMRADPQGAAERVSARASSMGLAGVADAFDGRTRGDLFMPHEVFRMLMNLAYLAPESQTASFRRSRAEVLRQQGLPADFWERLEVVAAPYIADAQRLKDIGATVPKLQGEQRERALEEIAVLGRDACRSRAEALAAARREFAAERFDRFLYESVAANMFHATDRLPSPAQLLSVERGCR